MSQDVTKEEAFDDLREEVEEESEEIEVVNEDGEIEKIDPKVESEKDIEPLKYDKARLEDDGHLGMPKFSKDEIRILENNLYMDVSTIEMNQSLMKEMVELIKSEDEDGEEKFSDSKNVYITSRNLLIQYQIAIDEYLNFLKEHEEGILSILKTHVDNAIKKYTEEAFNEFGIEYKQDSFANYITTIALKRAIKNIDNDPVIKLFHTSDEEFEKEIFKVLKTITFMTSNGSKGTNVNGFIKDEQEIVTLCTRIVHKFNNFNTANVEELLDELPAKTIALNYIYNYVAITNRKTLSEFRVEKTKHKNKCKKVMKRLKKDSLPELTLEDNFVKTRLRLLLIEIFIKRWFSKSLFGDMTIIENKDKFRSVIEELNSKFKTSEILIAIVNSISFKYIFDEFERIINVVNSANFPDGNKVFTSKDINLIKNYIVYISYHRSSYNPESYGIEDIYEDYINLLIKKIHGNLMKK